MAHITPNTESTKMKYEKGEKLRLVVKCQARETQNLNVIRDLPVNTIVQVVDVSTTNRRGTLDSSDADASHWEYRVKGIVEYDIFLPGGIIISTGRIPHGILSPEERGRPNDTFYTEKTKLYLLKNLAVEYIDYNTRVKVQKTLRAGTAVFTATAAVTKNTGATTVRKLEDAHYEIDLGVVAKAQVEVISRGWHIFQDLERL